MVQRAAVRALRANPAAQHRRTGALLGLGEQVEQDRQLRLVVKLAGEDGQRVLVQDDEQLIVGEAEEGLEMARSAQKSWFSPPKTSDTESSVKIRRIVSVSR